MEGLEKSFEDMVESNRSSWRVVKAECDRLESQLAEKRITLDQFFDYLQHLDPSAKNELSRMSEAIKDIFARRVQMDSFFSSLSQGTPSTPVRFRRLNRA
jgi:hypothetical protein